MEVQAIQQSQNRIAIAGNIRWTHLREFFRAVSTAVEWEGYELIELDFTGCEGITAAVMLPWVAEIDRFKTEGTKFRLLLPQDDDLAGLFVNANWAFHIDPTSFARNDFVGGHVPALRFASFEEQSRLVDRVLDLVIHQLDNVHRRQMNALEWPLWEVTDNVLTHAMSENGGFVQATAYRHSNSVEFVVADSGIGIPESMEMPRRPKEAVQRAVNEGVTSKPGTNAGNGLFGTYRVAVLSGGQFQIESQNAHLFANAGEVIQVREERDLYHGTAIRCRVKCDVGDLLERALQFKGKPHVPDFDYVERKYENAGSELVIKMHEYGHAFGSRAGGQQVRRVIQNLLSDTQNVTVDFEGVGMFSSSFADEVFGHLFVDLGPVAFMSRIRFKSMDATLEGLVDRAITQRTQRSR